ncbi:hypothetical protein [Legionella gresilensis]|uniref:hypothetical protein n=1 Tax=Legionella gresilensis TaxID=91823 RepID=UPI00104131CB|nr:hypothetical protein [Legionella gresilensis]
MNKKAKSWLGAITFSALASLSMNAMAAEDQVVRYKMVFVPTWNLASHPTEYPAALEKWDIFQD